MNQEFNDTITLIHHSIFYSYLNCKKELSTWRVERRKRFGLSVKTKLCGLKVEKENCVEIEIEYGGFFQNLIFFCYIFQNLIPNSFYLFLCHKLFYIFIKQ
jgi:hypothetical protein